MVVRVARSDSACALPRPSATDSARFAKSTVIQSQIAMPQLKDAGSGGAARRLDAEERLGDRDHGRQQRADLDDEHDRVAPHEARIELAERARDRRDELREGERSGARREVTASRDRWSEGGHGQFSPSARGPSARTGK